MTRTRALGGHFVWALAGVLVGALLVVGIDSLARTPSRGSGPSQPTPTPTITNESDEPGSPHRVSSTSKSRPRGIVLAWAPGGIPQAAERAVERLPGVRRATTVFAGLDWIESARRPDGTKIPGPPEGMRIPFEVAAVRPRQYARFVPPSERGTLLALKPGRVLLAESSVELRGGGAGMSLDLMGRRTRVSGVISDVATNGYEAILATPPPKSWARVDRFLLVHNKNARRAAIERAIRKHLEPDLALRIRVNNEQPFLRYGDAVHPQLVLKKEFGEFAARPLPDGRIEIDSEWQRTYIRRAAVPVLGEVTCHRALIPQLRRAMQAVKSAGLTHLIDTSGYGGCYGPRFINSDPGGRLSHHSWGIAFDINVPDNPYAAEPNMPPRLVETIERSGFTWGGRWLVPDGMHFEWQSW
ncbi:MAG TPA: M15 family metallopeptidase [Actinomycetota bacterium]|nr:M15 family metallopeptidase [Actinomycetota bacterium]